MSPTRPAVPSAYISRVSVRAKNVTAGKTERVLPKLVFGILFDFIIISTDLPNQKEMIVAIKTF